MSYIKYARKIYDSINKSDFTYLLSANKSNIHSLEYVAEHSDYKSLQKNYLRESTKLIKDKLNIYDLSSDFLSSFQKKNNVEKEMPKYMLFYLFWIWHNEFVMDNEILERITKPIFPGFMGYMIVDSYIDSSNESKEKIYIGLSLIKLAEEIFGEVFQHLNPQTIFNKHFAEYSKVQFIELRNLWKECPFTWEESWRLGVKSAPSFSILEILFNFFELQNDRIKDLMDGILYMTSGTQIIDDIADTKIDLANGFETLIMKGFYSKYSIHPKNMENSIDEFLSEERLETIYTNTHALFDKANQLFDKHNDEIFIMFNEYKRYQFNSLFKFS